MTREQNVWRFVEEHYPDYSSSDAIAWEGDLHKLVNGEYEDGDCAYELLMNKYEGDISNPQIKIDWIEQYVDIIERAIENWQNKQV